MKIYRFEKYDVAEGVSLAKHGIMDERIGQFYEIKGAFFYMSVVILWHTGYFAKIITFFLTVVSSDTISYGTH